MTKLALVLGVAVTVLVVQPTSQVKIIYPTYRPLPQPRQPVIRTAREVSKDPQSVRLNIVDGVINAPATGEDPVLPSIIDDVKLDPNTRHARSLSTPGHGRSGTSDRKSGSSSGRDIWYSSPRRNARSLRLPDLIVTPHPFFNPKPWLIPTPHSPIRFPIYV